MTTATRAETVRPRVSPSSVDLVGRAHDSLVAAVRAATPGERYVAAHLAALRGAAAVLAVRGRPSQRGGPRSVWEVLPRVAPELAEWAAFFDAGAARRAAVEAGRDDVVTPRGADDLVRDAETFLVLVEAALGLPRRHVSLGGTLPLPSA
jgi:hypothetical protein